MGSFHIQFVEVSLQFTILKGRNIGMFLPVLPITVGIRFHATSPDCMHAARMGRPRSFLYCSETWVGGLSPLWQRDYSGVAKRASTGLLLDLLDPLRERMPIVKTQSKSCHRVWPVSWPRWNMSSGARPLGHGLTHKSDR